ncbi:MAG: hypothetical protein ACE5H0_03915 [Bacteroidota bacterium]
MAFSTIAMAQLPGPQMIAQRERKERFVTELRSEILSPYGVSWDVVGKSRIDNRTVEDVGIALKEDKHNGMLGIIRCHYYLPIDHSWKSRSPLEQSMQNIELNDRQRRMNMGSLVGSGAEWQARYTPSLEDGKKLVSNLHLDAGGFIGGSAAGLLYGVQRDGYLRLEWGMHF